MAPEVLIGSIAIMVACLLLWWGLYSDRRSGRVKDTLAMTSVADTPSFRELAMAPSAGERLLTPLRRRSTRRLRRLTPSGSLDAMERRIHLAGAQETWNVERLLAAKVIVSIVAFVLCIFVGIANESQFWIIAAFVLLVAGYFIPDGLLDRRADDRQGQIQDEMPDVIDQVMISVQAGLSFDAAIDRVAQGGRGPFAEELNRVVQDIRLGMSRHEALEALAERTNVTELDEFVVAMNQAELYGLSISQVLAVQADELRIKRKQRAEERAHKIPVKMVVPLIFCIFPTIFIAALGPAVIRAVNFDYGFSF